MVPSYRLTRDDMEESAERLGCWLVSVPYPNLGQGADPMVILVTANSTDTRWAQALAQQATAVCLPRGRLRWSVTVQGQAVWYFGAAPAQFLAEFGRYGVVVVTS